VRGALSENCYKCPRRSRSLSRIARREIALNVTNHIYLDVVIYVVHDGQQTRVGTVPSRAGRLLSGRRSPPGLLLDP